jgi:hypothetical protein
MATATDVLTALGGQEIVVQAVWGWDGAIQWPGRLPRSQ